jgi:predicted metal-binding protein
LCNCAKDGFLKINEESEMESKIKIGIIICDRYRTCAGGKCFRALKNREGAFSIYDGKDVELVGYTTCDGCPGGNIEYTADEMMRNGAEVIHFATGMLVGYPPCPYMDTFKKFLEQRYKIKVIAGTHPIPQKYRDTHFELGTWNDIKWQALLEPTMTTEKIRKAYD